MNIKILILILSAIFINKSISQNLEYVPTKSFYINSAKSKTDDNFTNVSEPFEIVIKTNSINIGDYFDLKIINREYRKNSKWNITELTVEDPSSEYKICKILLATNDKDNYMIATNSCELKDDGEPEMIMSFINSKHIAWYELWRNYRNE